METTEWVAGLRCQDCRTLFDAATAGRCPDCGGTLDVDLQDPSVDRDAFAAPVGAGLSRYAPVLPFSVERLVSTGAGGTPVVDCPDIGDALGVGSLAVKDEGRNPTGALADRGAALAVTAAREQGATDVALPSMGNTAQAVAAVAARAGLASHAFVPSRVPFVNKAMINVHGGDMTVVGGRYADAAAAFRDAVEAEGWHRLDAFSTPFRHEGLTTAAYELCEQFGWAVPDAVVVPTGHGTAIAGLHLGFRRFAEWGLIDERPRLYAVQAEGCAPIVTARDRGASSVSPVETPDTVCGPLEIPEPAGGRRVLDAVDSSDGGAVAVDDEAMLEAAVDLAEAGLTAGVSAGAALAGARTLATTGDLAAADDVVLVNPTSGTKEADLLRSRLMSQGQ